MTDDAYCGRSNDVTVSLKACPFCGETKALEIIKGSELMDENQEFWEHQNRSQ